MSEMVKKCMITGETDNLKTFRISGRYYGSIFDCDDFTLVLSKKYADMLKDEWFDEKPTIIDYVECYKYEQEIIDFIDNNLPDPNSFWDMTSEAFNQNFGEMLDRLEAREMTKEDLYNAYNGVELKESAFTLD